jgi:hypothetical protein
VQLGRRCPRHLVAASRASAWQLLHRQALGRLLLQLHRRSKGQLLQRHGTTGRLLLPL